MVEIAEDVMFTARSLYFLITWNVLVCLRVTAADSLTTRTTLQSTSSSVTQFSQVASPSTILGETFNSLKQTSSLSTYATVSATDLSIFPASSVVGISSSGPKTSLLQTQSSNNVMSTDSLSPTTSSFILSKMGSATTTLLPSSSLPRFSFGTSTVGTQLPKEVMTSTFTISSVAQDTSSLSYGNAASSSLGKADVSPISSTLYVTSALKTQSSSPLLTSSQPYVGVSATADAILSSYSVYSPLKPRFEASKVSESTSVKIPMSSQAQASSPFSDLKTSVYGKSTSTPLLQISATHGSVTETSKMQTQISSKLEPLSQIQLPSNTQISSQTRIASNIQVSSYTQISSKMQLPSQSQMSLNSQISSQTQLPSQTQISSYTQISSTMQLPSQSEILSNSQISSQSQTQISSYAHISSKMQLPSLSQISSNTQIVSQTQLLLQTQMSPNTKMSSQTQILSQSQMLSQALISSYTRRLPQTETSSQIPTQSYSGMSSPLGEMKTSLSSHIAVSTQVLSAKVTQASLSSQISSTASIVDHSSRDIAMEYSALSFTQSLGIVHSESRTVVAYVASTSYATVHLGLDLTSTIIPLPTLPSPTTSSSVSYNSPPVSTSTTLMQTTEVSHLSESNKHALSPRSSMLTIPSPMSSVILTSVVTYDTHILRKQTVSLSSSVEIGSSTEKERSSTSLFKGITSGLGTAPVSMNIASTQPLYPAQSATSLYAIPSQTMLSPNSSGIQVLASETSSASVVVGTSSVGTVSMSSISLRGRSSISSSSSSLARPVASTSTHVYSETSKTLLTSNVEKSVTSVISATSSIVVQPTTQPEGKNHLEGNLTLTNLTYQGQKYSNVAALGGESTEKHRNVIREIEEKLQETFRYSLRDQHLVVKVEKLRDGSIIVDFKMSFRTNSFANVSSILKEIERNITNNNFVLVGDSIRLQVSKTRTLALRGIDECKTGQSKCHVRATCADTDLSYKCTCKQGYEGDGFFCTEEYKDKDFVLKIVGITLAVFFGAVILVIMLTVLFCVRNRREKMQSFDSSSFGNGNDDWTNIDWDSIVPRLRAKSNIKAKEALHLERYGEVNNAFADDNDLMHRTHKSKTEASNGRYIVNGNGQLRNGNGTIHYGYYGDHEESTTI